METVFDFAGIGIGPFNLGLAALSAPINNLNAIFFDGKPGFCWHPGLLLENAALQVTFYADLVTLADPTSPFSFLSYLKEKGRLIPFGCLENNYITRREYNEYCKWVAKQLSNLYFNHEVKSVCYDRERQCYNLQVFDHSINRQKIFYAKKLVIGVGSVPQMPICVKDMESDSLFHSSAYLYHKKCILKKKSVTIVGSGQSAAEIFEDLLAYKHQFSEGLYWITKARRFYPMDYSKLTLEMSTPDYIDYFYRLTERKKEMLLQEQDVLYKGINDHLIERIYAQLYHLNLEENNLSIGLFTDCELQKAKRESKGHFLLTFYHREMERCFSHQTESVILSTGYKYEVPSFLEPVRERIQWDSKERYLVGRNYDIDTNGNEIFVQNAELHTHGFNAPDLSLGPYRNAVILKEITGYDYGVSGRKNTFQQFGIPPNKAMGLG